MPNNLHALNSQKKSVIYYVVWEIMLVTHERFQTKNHLYMLANGETLWDMVQLELSQIYFFINYEVAENEVWLGQHAMVWQLFTFMAVCSGIQDSPNKRIVSASLMIPPYISESGQWEMIGLKEIWLASQKKKKDRFFVYVTENGKRHTEHSGVDNLSDDALENIERFFPLAASERDTSMGKDA